MRYIKRAAMLFALLCIEAPVFGQEALKVLNAYLEAYPNKIQSIELHEGDWCMLVNGVRIYWAEGRLLPFKQRDQFKEYSPYHFNPYPEDIPPIRLLDKSQQEQLELRISRQEKRQDKRSQAFLEALWGINSNSSASNSVKKILFLGKKTTVHADLVDKFKAVENRILSAAQNDPEIQAWIENLESAYSFVWRDIAGSANRSLHSYGIAMDLVPRDYGTKSLYWRWSRLIDSEWWAIPYSKRYFHPEQVIKAFEAESFLWGGKWMFFDQIHFEYRPEYHYF